MLRIALSLACGVVLSSTGSAAPLDPETNTPYHWRVVVQARSHPLFPASAREQTLRDVRAALLTLTGPLARVEVIDLLTVPVEQREPLWKQFAEKGWSALDAPDARTITGVKTHFLKIDVRDETFHLEARQLDGDTGLPSPVLRKKQTNVADTVGRVAGLLIGKDFGPVATIETMDPKAGVAQVRFRAGALGGMDRHARPGDVMAVVAVIEPSRPAPRFGSRPATVEPPPPKVAQRRAFTLLRIREPVSAEGVCRCQILSTYANPMPQIRGVAGFRGLLLTTVDAPLSVRVVDPKSGEPVPGGPLVKVRASDADFPVRPDASNTLQIRDGVLATLRPMRNVACVVVGVGAMKEQRFPVPVFGDGVAVALPFQTNEADTARAEFERACQDFQSRVAETHLAQVALFDALTKLITRGEYATALERAKVGVKAGEAAAQEFSEELSKLKGSTHASDPLPVALIRAAENQLVIVRGRLPAVKERITELEGAVAKSQDPARFEREFRAKELSARIKQHLQDGEVPPALDLYDQLFTVTKDDAAKKQREKLAAEWKSKGPDQDAARDYIANDWRKASTAEEFKTAIPKLTEAVDMLIKYDDAHGLRGLLASLAPAYTRLKEIADLLDANSDADRPVLKDLQDVTRALNDLDTKARDKLKTLTPPTPEPKQP